jgi:benzoyl-CoA reductase/2-hydroxyglutaryl-CoA dehydratase subunit BcrC/BadD/HgdB
MRVFYTRPWIPPEWIKAYGFEPCPVSCSTTHPKTTPTAQGICGFSARCCSLANANREVPFVFDSSCDQMRRGFDTLVASKRPDMFLFNLPAAWQTPAAAQIFRVELMRLGGWLVKLGGREPSREALLRLINVYSQERRRLLMAAGPVWDRLRVEAAARLYCQGVFDSLEPAAPLRRGPIRLAVVGAHLPTGQWELLDAIERHGGAVVLNATDLGERGLGSSDWEDLERGDEDPVDLLTQRYCRDCVDAFQRPNTRLYDWLRERFRARRVQGIVLWSCVGCDLWRAEAQTMREGFGLPVCLLEEESAEGCSQRTLGRLEAFMELLR